jgi:hypothetical protein
MNRLLSTIVAIFFVIPFTTAVFAADASKPVVPQPPIVAAQSPAADDAAKIRAEKLRMRNVKAKAVTKSLKKDVVAPASPAADSAASKKGKRLAERNKKARETTKAINSDIPKETAPVVPPSAK